jgi:hypothetical protein
LVYSHKAEPFTHPAPPAGLRTSPSGAPSRRTYATSRGGRPMSRPTLTAVRLGMEWGSTPHGSSKDQTTTGPAMRTQVRLAAPAERWGGFGTCVR